MKSRERLAVLRLATLIEEFTPEELDRAADALSGVVPLPEQLRALLLKDRRLRDDSRSRARPMHLRESKAVRALRGSDPARYELLAGFEVRLRKGDVFSATRQLRGFAQDLGVDVGARGGRHDIVSRTMAYLAELPLEAAREIISGVPEGEVPDDGYHRLATYLHKGYDPGPTSEGRELPNESEPARG